MRSGVVVECFGHGAKGNSAHSYPASLLGAWGNRPRHSHRFGAARTSPIRTCSVATRSWPSVRYARTPSKSPRRP